MNWPGDGPPGLARANPTRTQNTEHRTQNTEHRTQNTEHRTQDTGTQEPWQKPGEKCHCPRGAEDPEEILRIANSQMNPGEKVHQPSSSGKPSGFGWWSDGTAAPDHTRPHQTTPDHTRSPPRLGCSTLDYQNPINPPGSVSVLDAGALDHPVTGDQGTGDTGYPSTSRQSSRRSGFGWWSDGTAAPDHTRPHQTTPDRTRSPMEEWAVNQPSSTWVGI